MNDRLLTLAIVLTIANFLYQAFAEQDWAVATERSYFQCIALFIVWFNIKLNPLT